MLPEGVAVKDGVAGVVSGVQSYNHVPSLIETAVEVIREAHRKISQLGIQRRFVQIN